MITKIKKEYICPEFSLVKFRLSDVLGNSLEDYTSYTGGTGDWGDLPPEDPGDDIWD